MRARLSLSSLSLPHSLSLSPALSLGECASAAEVYVWAAIRTCVRAPAWAITSAPLAIGFDLANNTLYDQLYPIVANKLAISINQQWLGNPGNLVANSSEYHEYYTEHGAGGGVLPEQRTDLYPTWMIWRKPLRTPAGGQAVLVINLSDQLQDVTVMYSAIDPSLGGGGRVEGTDVWSGAKLDLGNNATATTFKGVESHGNVFAVLRPAGVASD